jgi:hypothetical protein
MKCDKERLIMWYRVVRIFVIGMILFMIATNTYLSVLATSELNGYTVVDDGTCGGQGSGQHDFNGNVYMICGGASASQSDPGGKVLRVIAVNGSIKNHQLNVWATDVAPVHGGKYVFLATYRGEGTNPKYPIALLQRKADGTYTAINNNILFPHKKMFAEGRFIATDGRNNLYVASGQGTANGTQSVVKLSVSATTGAITFVNETPEERPNSLLGIAVTSSGETLYALSSWGLAYDSNSYVRQYKLIGSKYILQSSLGGGYKGYCEPGTGRLAYPYDIGLDGTGSSIFVISTSCGLVEKYSATTSPPTYLGYKRVSVPPPAAECHYCNRPHGLVVAGNGDVYVPQVKKKLVITRTATPTITRTATPTITRTATPTITRTATPTKIPAPGAFKKLNPANNSINRPKKLTLMWDASVKATSYEYCMYIAGNSRSCSTWISTGTARFVVRDLNPNQRYYWNVRARNSAGITIAYDGEFTFKTQP